MRFHPQSVQCVMKVMESIVTNLVLHVVNLLVRNAERIIQLVLNASMVME